MGEIGAMRRFGTVLASDLYPWYQLRSCARSGESQHVLLRRIDGGSGLPDHTQIFHSVICRTVKKLILAGWIVEAGKGSALAVRRIYTRLSCVRNIITTVILVGA